MLPDPEETSSIFSDFTYWRLEEGDTYKDLPHSQPRGGQLSLDKDSDVRGEHHANVSNLPARMESSTYRDHYQGQSHSQPRGGMQSLTKDSVVWEEAHANVSTLPAYMESSKKGEVPHVERGRARLVESPRTSSK